MTDDPAPRFQFSLADIFAALVSLAFPGWLISQIDLDEVNQPEFLGILVMLGLLIGFFGAIQYRRELKWRSVWVVPAFLLCAWSIFLMPYGNLLSRWITVGLVVYPPAFAGITAGLYYSIKLQRRAIIPGFVAFLIGFVFVSTLSAPGFPSNRRGMNETAATVSLKALAEAQEIYNRTDYDKDGVREYSTTIQGLFEHKLGAADLLLIDPILARADASVASPQPDRGYLFRILTAQGPSVFGGAKSYVDAKGDLTGGYAFIAYPAKYKKSGFSTFMISSNGTIRQKDLGPQTETIVKAMTEFDPDASWGPSE